MLSYLIKQSRSLLLTAIFASVLAGICSVLLVAQINTALTTVDPSLRNNLGWVFAVIAIIAMVSHMCSSVLFERLGQLSLAKMRHFISSRTLAADYRKLEEVGGPKIQSAITEHSLNVAEFFVSIPSIVINVVVVTGCLIYMAILSWQIFLVALCVIVLGSLGYHFAHLRAIRYLNAASKEQDNLFDHFRSLVEGAKELRLNSKKRDVFLHHVLGKSIDVVKQQRTTGMSIFVASAAWGNFLVYAFIGLVLFVLVSDVSHQAKVMTGFALVFVYMVTPLEALLLSLPRVNLARVSAQRIDEVTQDLSVKDDQIVATDKGFGVLKLKDIVHHYYHEQRDDIFTLGPINLTFRPGQISFLVGGNGSGKTTLAKLLVALYWPEEGDIVLNNHLVTSAEKDAYRQHFSAVFSDFHLFEQLLDAPTSELDCKGNELIKKLHLQHKVQVLNGAFTTRELSQGQRKRLALVVAYLEDRPFVVFDEWAADQDPAFKEVFYLEILPELRAQGKSILVISHDDRYFHLADQLIRMENGQITSIGPTQNRPGGVVSSCRTTCTV